MVQQIRRQGHITEATPGNIATVLQGPFHQARSGQYWVDDTLQLPTPQNAQQQLQSYWSEGQQNPQSLLAQQPIAEWAAAPGESQAADPNAGGSQWAGTWQG